MKLDELVKKIGKAVEDSKPYWEARRVARQVRRPADVSSAHAPRPTPQPRRLENHSSCVKWLWLLYRDGCLWSASPYPALVGSNPALGATDDRCGCFVVWLTALELESWTRGRCKCVQSSCFPPLLGAA